MGYVPANDDTFVMLATAPYDEWQEFSFSLDTSMERNEVLSVTFGDYHEDFPEGTIFLKTEYDLCAVSNLTVTVEKDSEEGTEEDAEIAPFYFDNIVVRDNAVPEPLFGLALIALAILALRKK